MHARPEDQGLLAAASADKLSSDALVRVHSKLVVARVTTGGQP
jgi:hypothetical protein